MRDRFERFLIALVIFCYIIELTISLFYVYDSLYYIPFIIFNIRNNLELTIF
jgi:hypothetical protein